MADVGVWRVSRVKLSASTRDMHIWEIYIWSLCERAFVFWGWLRRITHARQYLPLRSVIGVHAIMGPYLWTLCYRPWICSNDILRITMLFAWVWMQRFLLGLACVPPKSKSMMKRMRSYVLRYLKQVCGFLRFYFCLCCCVWNWTCSFRKNILAAHINSY